MSEQATLSGEPQLLRVLMVDDSPDDVLLLVEHLRSGGYAPHWRRVATEATLAAALQEDWDLVLADYTMPGFSGRQALAMAQATAPMMPCIFVSATLGEEAAVQALQAGARDYVTKTDLRRLLPAIARELRAAAARRRQRATDARMRHLLTVSADAVIGFDAGCTITMWSDGARALLGYEEADIVGEHMSMLIPEHQWPVFNDLLAAFRVAQEPTWRIDERVDITGRRLDGTPVPIEASLSRYSENAALSFLLVLRDISERRQNEREMRVLLAIADVANSHADLTDTLRVSLDQLCRVLGWSQAQIWQPDGHARGLMCSAVVAAAGAPIAAEGHRCRVGEDLPGRAWHSAQAQWCELDAVDERVAPRRALLLAKGLRTALAVPIMGEHGPLAVIEGFLDERRPRNERSLRVMQTVAGQIGNAMQRKQAEQRLQQLAHYDSITGLPNRVLFTDRLERAMAEADRHGGLVGVIFVDLDRFKSINDGLGHDVGDQLLLRIAERLRVAVRVEDSVARLAGDEFGVLVPNLARADDLARVANKLLEAFQAPFDVHGQPVRSGASLGLTLYPLDERSISGLLRNADSAMYRSKERGGGVYCFFEPDMASQAGERLALEADLQRAIEQDELFVCYQPIKALISGRVTGVEALVRWQHPQRGLLMPDMFIPLAEDCGLIHDLGEWVLRRACADVAGLAAGGDFKLAVNVSARQLKHAQFATRVMDVLAQTGFDPRWLEFEVTESALLRGADVALDTVHQLGRQGVRFSVDDFGTGYSSLAYLRQLPIDKLKIDPSFICQEGQSVQNDSIVAAIIALAKSLGVSVVAEGVEFAPQVELLAAHGCNEVQGFLISHPLLIEDLRSWLVRD